MSELIASAEMLDAFGREAEDYWPPERELLASILEVLHSLLIVTLKVHGAKRIPPQIRVPRPRSVVAASGKQESVSMKEYISTVVKR